MPLSDLMARIGGAVEPHLRRSPWTNVYGLARTLLALGTLGTLLLSSVDANFSPAQGMPPPPFCDGTGQISLFCVLPDGQLQLGRWLAIGVLAVVASGWRPRWTAIPHWWVAFSFHASSTLTDGGDQVTAILTLLLVPVALLDGRRWHWAPPERIGERDRDLLASLLAHSAMLVVRIQVAAVYFHSSVAKLGVREWADGTAMHYWLTDPSFGAPPWFRPLLDPIVASSWGVTLFTLGVVFLELALALGLVLPRRAWPILLRLGFALHTGIALLMGLASFTLAMFAALLLFLRPVERPLSLPRAPRPDDQVEPDHRRPAPPATAALGPPARAGG